MTTNAQAALQAAATTLAGTPVDKAVVFTRAKAYKAWLDEQDDADREAWRKDKTRPRPGRATSGVRVVPEGAGNIDGVAETRGGPVTQPKHYEEYPVRAPGLTSAERRAMDAPF